MNQPTVKTTKAQNVSQGCSRRNFLIGGTLAVAVPAAGLGAFYYGYSKVKGNPVRVAALGTGDEGNVLLGAINPDYVQVVAIADIRPYNQYRAFHGDHYSDAALQARCGLMSKYGWKTEDEARKHVAVYADYRDLLNDAHKLGIEAVIIGLPLHLHATASVQAMKRGLHVLCEKLMGHSIIECKEMARAAKMLNKHLAIGHQRHYNILYHEAVDQIERGLLGDLHYIRAQWHRGNSPGADSWQMPMPNDFKPYDPQADKLLLELEQWKANLAEARGLEIETWRKKVAQKEAELSDAILADHFNPGESGRKYKGVSLKSVSEYGYTDRIFGEGTSNEYRRPSGEELIRWRLWSRTGGGLMVELGSHQLDAASIFLAASNRRVAALRGEDPNLLPDNGKVHPLKVHVSANRNLFGLDREVQDHITTLVEFPSPYYNPRTIEGRKKTITVQYSTINGNGFGGYGEIVFGTKGTIILEREQTSQLLRGPSTSKIEKKAAGTAALDTQASAPAQKAVAATGTGAANVSRGYQEEIEHWAWCVRENPNVADPKIQPRCNPRIALGDAVIALVTNIAANQGRSVDFKESWFDPDSDETPENDLTDNKAFPNLEQEKYAI
ncbi:MAG: Gfo/Idh/MocA family oxidoreductase [Planctomycetia bacterium]|nr:Gfo/Idh/MocA family oxidoreductase [Planctomycetia bacterium]